MLVDGRAPRRHDAARAAPGRRRARRGGASSHETSTTCSTGSSEPALLLILDGVTDPHNLGACLRVADAMGVHAVIAPKDRAAGMNPTVSKVASGAAETVPFIAVTNLARTMRELQGARDLADRRGRERGAGPLLGCKLEGPHRLGAGRGRGGHAPAHAGKLRRAGAHSDARHRREPECLGGCRHLPRRNSAAEENRGSRQGAKIRSRAPVRKEGAAPATKEEKGKRGEGQ